MSAATILRRTARLGGLLLFLTGVGSLVLLITPGPTTVAEWMGRCRTDLDAVTSCDAVDAIGFLLVGTPTLIVIGAVLVLALRPADRSGPTLDLRWLGRLLRGS